MAMRFIVFVIFLKVSFFIFHFQWYQSGEYLLFYKSLIRATAIMLTWEPQVWSTLLNMNLYAF